MIKKFIFNKICRDIRSLKIQSATNLAKKAFYAYKLFPNKNSKKTLLGLRPTEPMLFNILNKYDNLSVNELNEKLNNDQDKINKNIYSIIKNNSVIYTHCHATSVIDGLIYSKNKGKNFEVYNTETRPRFQGRKTAIDLKKAKIKVTLFVDSAIMIALTKAQDKEEKTRPVDMILIGADAITKTGVINKVGSGMIGEIARINKIPLYVVSNSLKFSNKKIPFEQRDSQELWKNKPLGIKVVNPAFEFINKKDIKGIISELGVLSYDKFLREVNRK